VGIILLSEALRCRAAQARELEFYLEQKRVLEARLSLIRRELSLTDTVLALIRKEQLMLIRLPPIGTNLD
jgi:hypothetical protein